jgi:hypothetical protein
MLLLSQQSRRLRTPFPSGCLSDARELCRFCNLDSVVKTGLKPIFFGLLLQFCQTDMDLRDAFVSGQFSHGFAPNI